jgi:hypothetical protein
MESLNYMVFHGNTMDAVRRAVESLGFTVEAELPRPSPVHYLCRDARGEPCYMIVARRAGDEPYVIRRGRLDRLAELERSGAGRVYLLVIRDGNPSLITLDDLASGRARIHRVYVAGKARSAISVRRPAGARTTLCISCAVDLKVRFSAYRARYGISSEELLDRALRALEREMGVTPKFVRGRGSRELHVLGRLEHLPAHLGRGAGGCANGRGLHAAH